jgi:hypothetical protein
MRIHMGFLVTAIALSACVEETTGDTGLDDGKADGTGTQASPFDPASCSGPTISRARLAELTSSGAMALPEGKTWRRTRTCNAALGCGAWSAPVKLGDQPGDNPALFAIDGSALDFVAGYLPQAVGAESTSYHFNFRLLPADPASTLLDAIGTHSYRLNTYSASAELDNVSVSFTGDCLRAFGEVRGSEGTEQQIAFVVTF